MKNSKLVVLISLALCLPMAARGLDTIPYIFVILLSGGSFAFLISKKESFFQDYFYLILSILLALNIISITFPIDIEQKNTFDSDLSGVWMTSNKILRLEITDDEDVFITHNDKEKGTYSLMEENNKLSIEGYFDEDYKFEILEVSANNMKIKDIESDSIYFFTRSK